MRCKQPEGRAGSLKWIQRLVNKYPRLLDSASPAVSALGGIEWVSPLEADDYSEYRDECFLERLKISLPNRRLANFWPARGPQWDALGRTTSGGVVLVEGKAHTNEIESPGTQSVGMSRESIERTLSETKQYFDVGPEVSWLGKYYQYANRLSHLYLLREVNGIDAHLLFVYFVGDRQMHGPLTAGAWRDAIDRCHSALGLPTDMRRADVIEAFVDVADLS